jgi:ABC-type dipeptide/oligopeptide/nickel transport system permease component
VAAVTHESYPVSIWIATAGVFVGIVTGLAWGATNCSWWQHSFCNDTATTGFIGTIIFVGVVVAILMFLLGGTMWEINTEARLSPPEIDNEVREEYERQSITWRPFVPNLMIVTGLILAVGVDMAILGALSAQHDRDFYQVFIGCLLLQE